MVTVGGFSMLRFGNARASIREKVEQYPVSRQWYGVCYFNRHDQTERSERPLPLTGKEHVGQTISQGEKA